ncbi:hypothetical protein MHYP_G00105510 [Metynnis hypsauchen]
MTVCGLSVFVVVLGVYVEYTLTDSCSTLTVSHESLLVEYGQTVELTCSIPSKPSSEFILGWESEFNPVQTYSETSLVWRLPSVTEWKINGREMFCYLSVPNQEQCKQKVHLNLYKRPDSVKISSESSVWSEGQRMELKCEIENVGPLQNLTVQWTRVDQNKHRTVTEMSYGNFSASGEKRKSGNVTATLNVSASRDEDGVQYQCAALLKLEQLQQPQVGSSEPLNITVHYSCSTLTVSHESLLVEYGQPVELNCSIPSKPSSQYILGWESEFNPVQTYSETSLVWRSPGLTEWEVNGREMFCYLAVPNKEQCKQKVHLNLYKRPDSVKISSESSVWSEGQRMELKCEIENVGPLQNLTVQWTRVDQNKHRTVTEMSYGNFSASGEKLKSGNVTATLNVSASRDEDGVQYQCAALLKLEQLQQPQVGSSEPLKLTVHYKPTILFPSGGTISLTQGDELVLSCSAHGNPSPQYSWSSPGNKNLRTSSIFISSIQSEDQGQYICTAYNVEGSDSVTVMVNVAVDYKRIIIFCAVVGVVLLVAVVSFGFFKRYRRTRSTTESWNFTSHRHNGNMA